MIRKLFTLLLLSSAIVLNPSCVAKKKYLAMQSARQSAESEVAAKNQRIEKMISEFEQMKNELMESNAIKNQAIDSLSGEVNKLAKVVNVKESAIGQKETSFEFEKRQLTEDLAGQKKIVQQKQNELDQLSGELQKLKDELSQNTFDLNREKDEKLVLQGNMTTQIAKIAELNTATDKLKTEIQGLKKQLSDKNETITRLENNVKLLKQQMK
ncbi:MAG: hypothetical protein WC384_07110 [Prolixibacteraceae bacterium]|jgi:chromosome segregation ATPase